jgi:hypothetical protein
MAPVAHVAHEDPPIETCVKSQCDGKRHSGENEKNQRRDGMASAGVAKFGL